MRLALVAAGTVVLLSCVACDRRDAHPEGAGSTSAPMTTPIPSSPVASERTVELVVEGMHCATCPVTVRTAARAVRGVVDVQVTMDPGRARVRYRPAETDPTRIAAAITNSGYPAHEVAQ
jgi:copper chaperone CopZ